MGAASLLASFGVAKLSPRSSSKIHLPPPASRRRAWALYGVPAALLLAVLGLLVPWHSLLRNFQDAFAGLYYGFDPVLLGRSVERFPGPTCCTGFACLKPRKGRVAAVTLLRTQEYFPLLQQLECTLRKSNPGLELAVMVVEGELSKGMLRRIAALNITILKVAPLFHLNTYEPRYGRNWLKLRVFGLEEFDALVLLDTDMAVVGDLSPLFALPVDFAAVWDQNQWLNRYKTVVRSINSGVLLVRPCAAVEAHMLRVLGQNPKLRFTHAIAEQDFLAWYFKYTGMVLPVEYNVMSTQSLVGNLTVGGRHPVVIHMLGEKPFNGPRPGQPGHHFLCSLDELNRRAIFPPAGR